MSDDFIMCARAIESGQFIAEPGKSSYLLVPEGELPSPDHEVKKVDAWVKRLQRKAVWDTDSRTGKARGDILVFIHGYNNSQKIVMQRHRQLSSDLREVGFKGAVMSFDWPSEDMTLNYVEDRHDAKKSALQLVTDGIRLLAAEQGPDCTINIHLLGHSTGAYVIREAFDDADDARLNQSSWLVSQLVFIGGDISSDSLSVGNPSSEAIYCHCVRLTNYSNRYDSVLKLSNAKRLGMASRVGRVGLPTQVSSKAINIDCSDYFQQLESDPAVKQAEQKAEIGTFAHSWHIGNKIFARDLFETLRGDMDRMAIPTRQVDGSGSVQLKRA